MAAAKDLSSTLLACNIFLSALGAVLVILRLWVRFFKLRAASWDDYFIAAALVSLEPGQMLETSHLMSCRPRVCPPCP